MGLKVFEDSNDKILIDPSNKVIECQDTEFEEGVKFVGRKDGAGFDRIYTVTRNGSKYALFVDNT